MNHKDRRGKQIQSKIPMYFKTKNKEKKTNGEMNQIDHLEKEETILSQKEEIINERTISFKKEEDLPVRKRAKVTYSESLKNRMKEELKNRLVHTVYLLNERRIPVSTLFTWKNNLVQHKKKATQGRKTKFGTLEEELFNWFLVLRARKMFITDSMLLRKVNKIHGEIIEDSNMSLTAREPYKTFKCSNGWLQNFKKRHDLVRRAITTTCGKTIEEIRVSLTSYFKDLKLKMDTLNPKFVYNMDEVRIFFEIEKNHSLEIKGKKTVGKITSGKSKERVTVVMTACSNGTLFPPFLFLRLSNQE